MGKRAADLRLGRGPRTAAVLTFAVPGQGHSLRLPSDSRHRGWTFARPPAQTSLRRCAVGSRLAKARIAADRPGREVATWLLIPRHMVVLYACWARAGPGRLGGYSSSTRTRSRLRNMGPEEHKADSFSANTVVSGR